MPDADELVAMPAREALRAVLLRVVLLGHPQAVERLFGLLHAMSTDDVSGGGSKLEAQRQQTR
jgi:hypothetical protein